MAVRLDLDAVRDAVDPSVYREAEELLRMGGMGEITPAGGGAAASIVDNGPEVWAGVVAGVFTAHCSGHDRTASAGDPDGWCPHAVALVLGAVREDFAWSSSAARPLPPLTDAELAAVRRTVDSLAGEALAGGWDPHDIVNAGRWIAEELEPLVQHPASEGALRVVEHAARIWDGLAVHLHEAWEVRDTDPAEVGDVLRAVHVQVCEDLDLDADELVERLVEVIGQAGVDSCLDQPEDYLPLLGEEGVAVLHRRRY